MRSSLFKKYFAIFGLALILCIFMLGMLLLYFSAQYFISYRQNILMSVADSAAAYTAKSYKDNGYVHRSNTRNTYAMLGESNDALVVYVDTDGIVRICSDSGGCDHVGNPISASALEKVRSDGVYYDFGVRRTLVGGESRYTVAVGIPLWIEDNLSAGYIFVYSPMASLLSLVGDIFIVIEIASLLSVGAVALIMYFFIRRLTEPLREMSSAARSFGSGDFRARVSVSGNDEITSLAKVFNKMADDLVEIDETRRNLIANVAHELRTPMTTISGYIDGILDGTIPPENQKKYLEIVSEETKRLARMTSSTLALARMEEGSVVANMVTVNVWEILSAVMYNMERRILSRNITVAEFTAGEAFAACDSDMLHQVIYNLVDNAIKFTPEGGLITVNVIQDKVKTHIIIRNTGDGIPKAELPFVFERFYKTDKSRAIDKTGSGLGLYIVKTLVQRMFGEIRVSSAEGEYCEFTVILGNAPPTKDASARKEGFFTRFSRVFKKSRKDDEEDTSHER